MTPDGRLPEADKGSPDKTYVLHTSDITYCLIYTCVSTHALTYALLYCMHSAAGLRQVFNRMGFNDQEIVALSGAHALGTG